jgi:large conductance mechanosensitive channel
VSKKEKRRIIDEFKEFINRGNVVDLSIAFVMGAAFKTVIDAFAGNGKDAPGILGGLLGALFGGSQPDFSKKVLTVNGSDIPFGAFATAGLNFIFVAAGLFAIVKVYNKFRTGQPIPSTNEILLEIRDELRTRDIGQK